MKTCHVVRDMYMLYSAATPNGWKVSIALEELSVPYEMRPIDLGAGEQKQSWYLQLNPNGKIPTLVDEQRDDFVVFESGAILLYLAEKHGRLLPEDPCRRSEVIQWLMFQIGGVGPMMGQANVFYRYAPEKIEYAIGRYHREVRRLLEVLDRRLRDREYLAGEQYSIADIANWSWTHTHRWSGVSIDGLDALSAWIERIGARPAVERGRAVPPRLERSEEQALGTARRMLA